MSKLDELIAEYCPNGVEYKTIEKLIAEKTVFTVTPSIKIKRNDYKNEGTTPIISQEEEYISGYCNISDKNITNKNYVCFGDHSEHIKFIDFAFVQGADGLKIMFTQEDILLCRYFYHSCLSFYVRHNNYERHFKYLTETSIPVPPLPVQREIVRILDNFTELTAELTAELTSELTARKKQYEYYLEKLITQLDECEVVKLKDVCKFYNGDRGKNYPKVSDMVLEGIPFVNAGDVNGTVDYANCNKITLEKYNSMSGAKLKPGDILYCLRGSTGKNGIYEREGGTVASSLVAIRASERIYYKYLYYLLNSSLELKQRIKSDTGAAQPNLSAQNVGNYEFPLPSMEQQLKIVFILDRFYSICSDLTSGLPAEIEARQKQYKFYRDKLLSFKEITK